MIKKYINKLWFIDSREFSISDDNDVDFILKYNDLTIGELSFENGFWIFEYSVDFQNQHKITPLINFPQKDKKYQAKDLWPFFASRVPSNAQLMKTGGKDDDDLIMMLKKYGRHSITNPFELNAAF